MNKYIDAERLIAEIEELRSESCISESDDYYEYAKGEILDIIDSLQQEPAEWSEEDEKIRRELTTAILAGRVYDIDLMGGEHIFDLDKAVANRWITWLESLLSRPIKAGNWKPSEEQMEELLMALTPGKEFDCDILAELYEQLKKL